MIHHLAIFNESRLFAGLHSKHKIRIVISSFSTGSQQTKISDVFRLSTYLNLKNLASILSSQSFLSPLFFFYVTDGINTNLKTLVRFSSGSKFWRHCPFKRFARKSIRSTFYHKGHHALQYYFFKARIPHAACAVTVFSTLRTELPFVFFNEEEKRRLGLNHVKPLK